MVIHPDNQEAWTDYTAVADPLHRFATALDQKRGDDPGCKRGSSCIARP